MSEVRKPFDAPLLDAGDEDREPVAGRDSHPNAFSLRAALDRDLGRAPDVLDGVQQKLRERSGGRFYADGWSTTRHAPTAMYLLTALFMLAVCAATYAILRPFAGEPDDTDLTPAPVDVIAPRR
jgi:hypothetical protein